MSEPRISLTFARLQPLCVRATQTDAIGARSYRGKRVAEALTYGYARQDGVDVRVARIFNCFGPRMSINDGRLVSNFAVAALKGEPIEIYGDGQFTRSLMVSSLGLTIDYTIKADLASYFNSSYTISYRG